MRNLTIETEKPFEHSWDVTASFQFMTCWGSQAEYQAYSKVVFLVIEEGGRAVIDDVFTYEDGASESLKVALDQITLPR